MSKQKKKNLREYHFEFKHLTVLFLVLFFFQLIVTFINKYSVVNFLSENQQWYQKDSAEKVANLTTTSLELLLEVTNSHEKIDKPQQERIVEAINIIFSQQILQHNIEELCLIVSKNKGDFAIDNGEELFNYYMNNRVVPDNSYERHKGAINLFKSIKSKYDAKKQIYSFVTDKKTFHTLVPFLIKGEYFGTLYLKNTPDFSFITNQITSNFDEVSIIYISLLVLGLLAMYFISSYTVKERDEAQTILLKEHEENLKKEINYQKELAFTKRIYHTHHKAEKIMGFIKEDLKELSKDNIDTVKNRVSKYSNFVSRVIYDMKWYDPPLEAIRSLNYRTDLNEVLDFIIKNIFQRVRGNQNIFKIELDYDKNIPEINVNEFVVWELFEPLIQNSIDHADTNDLRIKIKTRLLEDGKITKVEISDNGKGVIPDLLDKQSGIKKIFIEQTTTKKSTLQNNGYGCYLAYKISKICGWNLDVENLKEGGCKFIITILN